MAVAHGLSSSAVCGVFPDQGSSSRLLHWQVDFSTLSHQGSPRFVLLSKVQTMSLVLHRSLCGLQSCSTHPCSLGWCLGLTMGHPWLALPCPVSFPVATHTHTHPRLNHLFLGPRHHCALLTLCPLPRVASQSIKPRCPKVLLYGLLFT